MTISHNSLKVVGSSIIVLFLALCFSYTIAETQPQEIILPHDSLQLVVVITTNINSSDGHIYLLEREHTQAPWNLINKAEKVVLGKKGLGWDRFFHSTNNEAIKEEGDNKSPAGIFYLNTVFGYAPSGEMRHLKMPYLHASETLKCIDDKNSIYYNRLIDITNINNKDWGRHEDMLRKDDLYKLGVTVEYNSFPVLKGKGSCIFLHVWSDSKKKTAGCTAMDSHFMKRLVEWLEIEKRPILIQLPLPKYLQARKSWKLPNLF